MRSSTNGAPRRRVPACVFLFLFVLFSTPVFADEETAAPPPLKHDQADIVVTATRTAETPLNVPQTVAVITREDIEKSGRTEVAGIIAEKTGIAISEYGARGSLKQAWIRGASANRVLVLLDGVPANNQSEGVIDLGLIPVGVIDRIEVVFGGASVLYGSYALNGVINIITKKGDAAGPSFAASEQTTAYIPQPYRDGADTAAPDWLSLLDGHRIALSGGRDLGFMSFFLAGSFAYDRNGYYYEDSDDVRRRDGAQHLGGDGFASVTLPWRTGSATVNGIYSRKWVQTPGSTALPAPDDAEQIDERIQVNLSLHEAAFFSELLTLDGALSFSTLSRVYASDTWDSDDVYYNLYADLSQKWSAADWVSLVYGGAFCADFSAGSTYGDSERLTGSGFLTVPVSIAGAATVSPAVRLDYSSTYGPEFTYACGLVVPLTPASSLKASFSKAFRPPTFMDLFAAWGSNPDLLPEDGYGGEIGYCLREKTISLDVSIFTRYMVNEIKYSGVMMVNLDNSLYPGVDLRIEWNFIDRFFLESAATFLYSFDLSGGRTPADDQRVPYTPIYKARAAVSYRTEETTVSLGCDLTGERTDLYSPDPLPPYFLLNASWRQRIGSHVTLTLAVDNALNQQYQVMSGYAMPGATVRFGAELSL